MNLEEGCICLPVVLQMLQYRNYITKHIFKFKNSKAFKETTKINCNQCLYKLLGFYFLHKYNVLVVLLNLLSNTIDKKSDRNQFVTISTVTAGLSS